MAINFEIENNLVNLTRRLGTRANRYLEDFYWVHSQYSDIKTFEDYLDQSENYSREKSGTSTIKQIEEVLYIFKLMNKDGTLTKVYSESNESFNECVTANIIGRLNTYDSFEPLYKGTINLIHSLVYYYGIEFLKESNKDHSEVASKKLDLRTSDMMVPKIERTYEFKRLINERFNLLLSQAGFQHQSKTLGEYTSKTKFQIKKIDELNKQNQIETIVYDIHNIIRDVIDPQKSYTIPFYQREYVWPDDLIENFINEIAYGESPIMNIGNILICVEGNNGSSINKIFNLVDGQQRLTSILMLFNIVSKKLSSINLDEYGFTNDDLSLISKSKNDNLITNLRNKSNEVYIKELKEVMNHRINEVFKYKGKSSRIKCNYEFMLNFVNGIEENDSIVNLFYRMKRVLSVFTIDNVSDQIDLFISTNAYSKSLSNYDLIRSFIISKIPENISSEEMIELKKSMDTLSELLVFGKVNDEKTQDTFFKLYLDYLDVINGTYEKSNKDLFKRFTSTFNHDMSTTNDVKLLIEQTISILKSYRVVKGVDKLENVYIKDFIVSLGNGLKSVSIYEIFLLDLVHKSKSINEEKLKVNFLNEYRKILIILEEFEIKWKIFNFAGDSLPAQMRSIFSKLYEKYNMENDMNNFVGMSNEIRELIKETSAFVNDVLANDSYNEKEKFISSPNIEKDAIALKILNRVCFNLYNSGVEYKVNSSSYFDHDDPSIEHIFPRTSKKWKVDNRTNHDALEPLVQSIGNKFIFNKKENSSAGNKTFSDKMELYRKYNNIHLDFTLNFDMKSIINSGYKMNFLQLKEWTPTDVIMREDFILETLIRIWENN